METRIAGLSVMILLLALTPPLHARGPWRASASNTPGWQLMTPEERIEHQARIRGFTRYEDCLAYQLEHHRLMESRASQRNLRLRGGGRNFCEHLKPRQDSR